MILEWEMQNALDNNPNLAVLCYIEHPDGDVNVWTGIGDITWDGVTYTGLSVFAGFSGVAKDNRVTIKDVNLSVILTDDDNITREFVDTNLKGRIAKLWLVALSDDKRILKSPYQIAEIALDYQTVTFDSETVMITINGQQGFYVLEKETNISWSSEEQKNLYPDDTGFDLVSDLANKEVKWTRT